MHRYWYTASLIALAVGFICLVGVAVIPAQSLAHSVALALGVSLLPAGLISIVTAISSSRLIEEGVRKSLTSATKDLQGSIDSLNVTTSYLTNSRDLGLKMVYPNRAQALPPFMRHLEDYVTRAGTGLPPKQVIFVGSSLKGVIEDDPYLGQQLEHIIRSGLKSGCEFCFLLTHPRFSEFREIQEDRPPGGIAKEIMHAIAWLEDRGVQSHNIRLYKGTPTNFLIASTEQMLVNPYPYEREAYKCYCLALLNIERKDAIFSTYWVNHFHRPWHGETTKRDHAIRPNSVGYMHEMFNGPVDGERAPTIGKLGSFTDFFVMNDTGSYYLAVNIRGLESDIRYNQQEDGSYDIFKIGRQLSVKLLDQSRDSEPTWEEVGRLDLDNERNGFWQRAILVSEGKSFEAYSMIGVFDEEQATSASQIEGVPPHGERRAVLWKRLPITAEGSPKEVALPFGEKVLRSILDAT